LPERCFFRDLLVLIPTGIQKLVTSKVSLFSKQTLTGLKLLVVVDSQFPENLASDLLTLLYAAYSDYVLKDPFYTIDMPIRCSLFEKAVKQLILINVG
jgi:hypothetical protein